MATTTLNPSPLEWITSLPASYQAIASLSVALLSLLLLSIWNSESTDHEDFTVPLPPQLEEGYVGAQLVKPSIKADNGHIQCYSPATGRLLEVQEPASAHDIDTAIEKAAEAQKEWARTTFKQRRKVLRTLMRWILKNQDIIARAACLDSGKTKVDASLGEILVTVEKLNWLLKSGEAALKPETRGVPFLMMYKRAEVRYEPLGVVAACVSWNYPFHNLLGPIVSSIFAGNGIIVKGSEATAWSNSFFVDIVKRALSACGHNPDLVAGVNCWPEVADHLTSHPGISHITFIGSRPVAKLVAKSASKTLPALCIELGGKDASIILDDVKDLHKLSSVLIRGVFQSMGQNCIGIERIIALPKIYDRLVDTLEPRIKALRVGSILDNPKDTDVGAVISGLGFDRLERMINDAVKQGARLLAGGQRLVHPKYPQGHYFSPTLLVDVTMDMEIAREEVFGPVCLIMKAQNVTHAIQIANSTEYGLGGSVFGSNKMELARVANEMRCGMVAVNDFAVFYLAQMPFGGVGGSGYGRFMGAEGLRSVCNLKSVCTDRFPGISTSIPPRVDYPIRDTNKAWEFCKGLVEFSVGTTMDSKIAGLLRLISNS
ncbi:Meiotic Sister-Chromatid recombination aldehyde dehydrogenase [Orbilia oligospora]|nr:Meiotic Sister-Chromatid recombination aldehyde dehydrogenase [Orbilia oligospora]KAF3261960.1 Meiotic Sister-Chromatid recombination aldehyde dehydrogenase [Orbilia oligospora]KAF3266017.1 Meiotic Sister-Chromatid recombination aldehyde dehydrogenase [Orbilia oligospora]